MNIQTRRSPGTSGASRLAKRSDTSKTSITPTGATLNASVQRARELGYRVVVRHVPLVQCAGCAHYPGQDLMCRKGHFHAAGAPKRCPQFAKAAAS